ncbi:MAG TPA: cation:dicarboxylase symporter family transporter, partial [Metabacillus sp.]|nr:cation:dicarboxylase symporter family transporter [Metabacillus sp.]
MKRLWNGYLNLSLAIKITIALVLGIITGLVFGEQVVILEPLGALLMRLLNFIILPLIFFTLIVGVNQTKLSSLGRMGGKIFVYYIVSSGIAIMLGLLVANLFKTGNGLSLELGTKVEVPENPGFTSVLLNIVPTNIVTAFTEMNLLGIIFTAIVFGMALSYIRTSNEFSELGETLYGGIRALNEVALIVMKVILQYLPVGIFAIIAQTVGTTG